MPNGKMTHMSESMKLTGCMVLMLGILVTLYAGYITRGTSDENDCTYAYTVQASEPRIEVHEYAYAQTEAHTEIREEPPAPLVLPGGISIGDITLCAVLARREYGDYTTIEAVTAIAEVVLNRIGSPYFPDTVRGVIMQANDYGRGTVYQFHPAAFPGFEDYIPEPWELDAVRSVFTGEAELFGTGTLFFSLEGVNPKNIAMGLYESGRIVLPDGRAVVYYGQEIKNTNH